MGCRGEERSWKQFQQATRCGQWTRLLVSHDRVRPAAFCGSSESADWVPVAVGRLCTNTLVSHHLGTRYDCVLHAFEALHDHMTGFGQ